ncbi:MAG TPA: hypothetical protein VMX17_04645 [Candidatus Glassbacteria bacterium]|nr:hypothetical protein [Candidatus Glassbacteria bacterium]
MSQKEFISDLPGEWVLVKSVGESYIGRLVKRETPSLPINNGVVLSPCFEYMSSLVSDNQGGLSRNTAAIPMDLTLDECPVHLQINFLIYMDNLSEDDREEYQRVTQRCIDIVENTKKARRQAKSGIQVVSSMPNGISPLIKK